MQRNGFYAAMKTDSGVETIFIDEEQLRQQQWQEARERRRKKAERMRLHQEAVRNRQRRTNLRVLEQELKVLGMGAVLYWGYTAGLVELAFAAPVLVIFQSLICFRAGRWFGIRNRKAK